MNREPGRAPAPASLGAALLLLVAPVQAASAGPAPVSLPSASVDLSDPAAPRRTVPVTAGGDLQAAIDAAQPGDDIVLAPGATFSGSFTLPRRAAADGWVTIRSGGTLPPRGTRATAADAREMARVQARGTAPALRTAPGAHHYRLIGLDITAAPGTRRMVSLVQLGDGGQAQNTPDAQPRAIIIERSYIHGLEALDLRRGVALNSASTAIVDSTITEVHSVDSDSQAICGWNGAGPYLIGNNDLQASGENIMFGGADPSIPNALPRDIVVRGNTFSKPLAWKGKWQVKNLLELKIGQRVLVEDNVFSDTWVDAQAGFAINVKSTNQGGAAPWSNTSDVTIRNNVFRNVPSGITVAARPDDQPAIPASNVAITDNSFEGVGGGAGEPYGTLLQLIGYGGSVRNVTIANNVATTGNDGLLTALYLEGERTENLVVTGNVFVQGLYGIKGAGTRGGAASLAAFSSGLVFAGNTLIGADPADYGEQARQNIFRSRPAPEKQEN